MHSVSDLTTSARKTTGDVPPKLVGASTTVVGDKMYLFGGRLVTERRMVADLYEFDLESFVWARMPPHPDDDVPGARYFHSTDAWNNHLVVFGGMGHRPDASSADDLCVLNDVRFFDLARHRWLAPDAHFARLALQQQQQQGDPIAASSDDAALENAADATPLHHATHLSAVSPSTPADLINSFVHEEAAASKNGLGPDLAAHSQAQGQGHAFIPRARYAHLSSVTADRLVVIGGQDLNNVWLDDVCVFDLRARRWATRRPYPRHAGTYRSVAVAAEMRVRFPSEEAHTQGGRGDAGLGLLGSRFRVDAGTGRAAPPGRAEYTPSESLVHLPYSTEPTDEFPNDIYLYSNYNFTDVKRELEVFQPLPGPGCDFAMADRSSHMTGQALPPGLRFPTGAICGTHLIFAGTYLAHSFQSYSIWALDLVSMTWSRLDPGAALSTGSWFRAALWNSPGSSGDGSGKGHGQGQGSSAKLLIFGNRAGNLVEDYNRRLLSWDDVAVVDLEAFGLYQPPRARLDIKAQELGLAALEEGLMADFELVCDDGRRIGCSRKLLENRWPWFREQRRLLLDAAARALETIPHAEGDVALPPDRTAPIRARLNDIGIGDPADDSAGAAGAGAEGAPRPDPRLTPRSLMLSEPYPITMALLQYFYALALLTPLQHAPAVLSQLMLLSATYQLPHLQTLVKHAMHRALTPATSVGVYEVATLCSCQSLQIRALKSVMASSRRAGAGRTRGNSHSQGQGGTGSGPGGGGGGGSGGNDGNHHNGPSGGGGSGGGNGQQTARPRGMSDLRGLTRSDGLPGGMRTMGSMSSGTDGDQARYQEYGQGPGSTAQAQAAAWQSSAPSAYVSATTRTRAARIKHSVNLSMDSLYQALNSADEDYHDSDVDPYSSTAGSAWEDHDPVYELEHEREREHDESDTNSSLLVPAPPAAPVGVVRRVGSNPALSTYSNHGNYGSSSASSTHRPTSPQTLPPGRLTRNHYVGQSTLLSPTLASASGHQQQQQQQRQYQQQQQQHQYPSRLGIPRTRTSDSDLSGTASTTSTASSGRSSGLSPISPETPPLPTPVDPFGTAQASFFSKHAGGGGGGGVLAASTSASAPLTSIEEASLYDDDTVGGTRSHTPNGNALDVVHRAGAAAAAPPDTAAWKDRLRAGAAGGAGYGNPLPPSPLSPEPVSPAFSSAFSDTTSASTPKSPDAVSETRHTSFTRSLFSRQPHKLRASKSGTAASAESAKKQPAPSLLSTSTASSEDPSMWSDARDVKKAAKAEEKRRKKDEERRRIEQLALQLKASAPGAPRPGPKDGHSTLSGSSEERRRQANKWLEETDGLYGGAINTWGGL